YPQQGWAEQDPEEIGELAIKAISSALAAAQIEQQQLIALSFSAAMHSLIAVDGAGKALSPAIIWADGRSAEQADTMDPQLKSQLYGETGTPLHPMTPFMKLLWMKENNYEPYKQATYFMSIKEYLIYA